MTTGAWNGELSVATEWVHPERGLVTCVAAEAVAADLRDKGWRVRLGPLDLASRIVRGREAAVNVGVSYLDPVGEAHGIAVGASMYDHLALNAANEAVEQWTATLCTRRVLLVTQSRCCLMETLCGRYETNADEHTAVEANALLHDGADTVQRFCPKALRVAHDLTDLLDLKNEVLFVCRSGLPEDFGLLPPLPRHIRRVTSVEEASTVRARDPESVFFVLDPGMHLEAAALIVHALRKRFPRIRGTHPRHWCYAESDWARCLLTLETDCDVVLAAGGRPQGITAAGSEKWIDVRSAQDVRPQWLIGSATVGLVADGPSEAATAQQIIEILGGLGPLHVVKRQVLSESFIGETSNPLLRKGD
ncbi:hypothetical protein [Streptomyces sp. MS2.AVA.5]|uniref:Uncharacterized protein n=1 Tax=Streptomyces achmelvichensis TaxID=3134111 RepID=A0ACC6QA84_9ACTN